MKKKIIVITIVAFCLFGLYISGSIKHSSLNSRINFKYGSEFQASQINFNSNKLVNKNVQSALNELYDSLSNPCYIGYNKGEETLLHYVCNKASAQSFQELSFAAASVKYNNSTSNLQATNVQDAIIELANRKSYCNETYDKENETSSSYECVRNMIPSTITVANNNINLTYGTQEGNSYTYDGDGILSCSSSDQSKITCSVDTVNHKINLSPLAVTSSNVTITLSATQGTLYLAPSTVMFTASVGQRNLTITPINQTVAYGTPISTGTSQVTANNLANGDSITNVVLTPSITAVGTGTITASSLTTTNGVGNYNVTYGTGELTITPKDLTITANSQTIVFGSAIATGTENVVVDGLVDGDSLTAVTLEGSRTTAGTGTITPSAATTTNGIENYNVTYNTGVLTINKKALTITAKAQTITYGSSISTATSQVTSSGLVSGDSINGITLTASRTTAGTGTITPSAATTAKGAANYTITYNTGTLTINKATSTFSLNKSTASITCTHSVTVKVTTNSDGAITCSCGNSKATCSVSGKTVTINGEVGSSGTVTVTIKQAAGTNYLAASGKVTTTVTCYLWKTTYTSFQQCQNNCKTYCGSDNPLKCTDSKTAQPTSSSSNGGNCWCKR